MTKTKFPFKLALNSSTLFPFHLSIMEQIQVAAEAGYEGIEIWVKDVEEYLEQGGTLTELKEYIAEKNIAIVNGIAFFKWSDADSEIRKAGLEQAKREMQMLKEIGCEAVAAPPSGHIVNLSYDQIAEHFAELSKVARGIGIEPILEFWGKAPKLNKISEAAYIAIQSGVSEVKILLDLFHMYTGGSRVEGVKVLNGSSIGMVHVNDYPDHPPREVIEDQDRIFPGEGVGATQSFARYLADVGYQGYLSLELFIQDYGERSAFDVAKEGLLKVREAYQL